VLSWPLSPLQTHQHTICNPTLHPHHSPSPTSSLSLLSHNHDLQHITIRSVHCVMSRISHTAPYPTSSHPPRHCPYGQELYLLSLLLHIAPSCPALKRHSPCEESSERWWGPCEEAFESSWVLTTNFRTRHHVGILSTRGIRSGYPGSPRVIVLDFGIPMILDSPRGRPGPRGTIFEFFRFSFFFFLFFL